MTENLKLSFLKTIHTIIWLFFNTIIFYLLYAVIVNKIDKWIWICIGLIILEGVILIAFKNICPITLIARKYSNSRNDNFDIYLTNWIARYNKKIYSIIILIAIIILIYRLITQDKPKCITGKHYHSHGYDFHQMNKLSYPGVINVYLFNR